MVRRYNKVCDIIKQGIGDTLRSVAEGEKRKTTLDLPPTDRFSTTVVRILMLLLTRTVCLIRLAYVKAAPSSTQSVGRTLLVTPRPNITTSSRPCIRSQSFWFHSNSKATSSRVDIGMSAGDVGRQDDGESSGSVRPRPRVPVSSITAFGQGLGQAELQVTTSTYTKSIDRTTIHDAPGTGPP